MQSMVNRWKDKLGSIDDKQSTISNPNTNIIPPSHPPSHPPKPEQSHLTLTI